MYLTLLLVEYNQDFKSLSLKLQEQPFAHYAL